MSELIADPAPHSIVSPKEASRIVLVPNREILQRRVAEFLSDERDGAARCAPAVFMFSVWVEETAVRLRQLLSMVVPRSQDPWPALLGWARLRGEGHAFKLNAARQARAADRLLRQWQVDREDLWLDRAFFGQRRRVRGEMESEGVFNAEDWLIDLAELLSSDEALSLPVPEEISLEGFVEFTALERAVLNALERRGVVISRPEQNWKPYQALVHEHATPQDEWQAAALWAQSRLQAGARSLCVVVEPGVTASGSTSRRVRQAFSAVFHPREAARLDDPAIQEFHIPDAGRLSQSRAVIDALLLLRISMRGAEVEREFAALSQWLLSPHWADADDEARARARIELRLRERGLFRLSLAGVGRLAAAEGRGEGLRSLVDRIVKLPPAFPPDQAAEWCHAVLRHWGWPGPRAADPSVVAAERLIALIERLAGLSFNSLEDGVRLLESMCADTVIPFGGGPLSPVQILPPEIAVAGGFDGVWVCHLDDASWPPPVAANPYVPAAARSKIPRQNPDGQHAYYRKMTEMLCAAAPEVHLSWSRDAGQGPRNRSELIGEIPVEQAEQADPIRLSSEIWPAAQRAGHCAGSMEEIENGPGLPFPDEDAVNLPGGAGFFRQQAACPLLAYLEHRLAARFPEIPNPLADPRFRGALLHQALRELYERGGGARGLPSRGDIPAAVEAALGGLRAGERLTATGHRAEEGRLQRALDEWLKLDSARQGFAVAQLEQAYELALGRARVNVRVDRVDRLADGRLFLIDYKSGKSSKSRALKWILPRMQEPQLPLYAVLLEQNEQGDIGGLSFAAVNPTDCGFDGISDDTGSAAKGIRIAGERVPLKAWDWEALMRHWRAQAEIFRDEILEGCAEHRIYDEDIVEQSGLAMILRGESRHDNAAEGGEDNAG